jgi:iron(III) transport system ATP-binding protein
LIPAIELENITLRYAGRTVLDNLSFSIAPGEIVAVLGPSGCGKTSLLRSILGFETPTAGTIRLAGNLASRDGELLIPPEERGIGMVFQDHALWPHLTVAGNLGFGLDAHGVPTAERDARIGLMLEEVALTHKAKSYPGQLSGGERQRVAIARALVLEPKAVLLDEPLANLDVVLKNDLLNVFRALLESRRTTALFITHDLREAAAVAHRIAIVEQGRIHHLGTVAELAARETSAFAGRLLADFLNRTAQ